MGDIVGLVFDEGSYWRENAVALAWVLCIASLAREFVDGIHKVTAPQGFRYVIVHACL